MKLHIENFAKISSADLAFDGLTVVAGDNNTGKSTVGKVLYAIFRSMSQLDKRIYNERIRSIKQTFQRVTSFKLSDQRADRLLNNKDSLEQILEETKKDRSAYEGLGLLFSDALKTRDISDFLKEEIKKVVSQAQNTKENVIAAQLAYRVLDCVFHRQILPLRTVNEAAKIILTVKGVNTEITIDKSRIDFIQGTNLIKKARLIASPEVLSLLNVRGLVSDTMFQQAFDKYTLELAQELIKESRLSITEQELVNSKLSKIFEILSKVTVGSVVKDNDKDFAVLEEGNEIPTKVENLSMGMKFFALLHMMLQQGVLQDRDVLILDEPENHLHPEWQVVYAHVLVLLQKAFDLTVLVTSHSQFFVNALQRFAISEDIMSNTHFYISEEDMNMRGLYTFRDVTDNAGQIFRSFNKAYDTISRLSKEFLFEGE
jgi:predicted ATPase